MHWHCDDVGRWAVYNDSVGLLFGFVPRAFRLGAERVERVFALMLDRDAMRRAPCLPAWSGKRAEALPDPRRGLYNLGMTMRLLTGAETSRRFRASLPLGSLHSCSPMAR